MFPNRTSPISTMFTLHFIFLLLASSGSPELDSRELAQLIKNGNEAAFRTFFEEHHESLLRFLISRGVRRQDAEDLVQKAFVYIWEHRNDIDEDKSLRGYLFKIAYTRMLNWIRDNRKMATPLEWADVPSTSNPEDQVRHRELLEAVDEALREMPERRRMVFEFCFLQEFTYSETAEAMDISRKTVENHMGLALKDIRSALQNFKN